MRRIAFCLALSLGCSNESKEVSALRRAALGEAERVIVLFALPQGTTIAAQREAVLGALPEGSFELTRAYGGVPGFAGRARPEALEALRRDPRVVSVQPDEPGSGSTAQSGPFIRAPQARST